MSTMMNTQTSIISKSDAWRLQAVANARKYKTVLELRERKGLSWREVGERMNYSQSYARRIYLRAKMLLETEDKVLRLQHPKKTLAERAKTAATAKPLIKGEEMDFIRKRIRLGKYRCVIALREEKNLKYSEIAGLMGFSKSYVTALYHQAVTKREQLPNLFEKTS